VKAYPVLALLTVLATLRPGAQEAGPLTIGGTITEQPLARYATSVPAGASRFSFEAAVLTGAAAADAWAAAAVKASGRDLLLVPGYDPGSSVPEALIAARVRELYLKLDFAWASLTAGRQVINYRKGALWSPTDLFTELDLSGLSPVRRGSDALRLAVPAGATGALDLVAAPSSKPSQGRYATRISGLVAGIDASGIAYRDGANKVSCIGADFKADLVAGINGSILFSLPDSASGPAWEKPKPRASLGADYSIGDFIMTAEYYYNGGGAPDPSALGSHNAYASLAWKAGDFFTLSGLALADPVSGTWSGTLLAGLDVAQNASASAYAKLLRSASPPESWSAEAGLSLKVAF
jgi:hypothetical protein